MGASPIDTIHHSFGTLLDYNKDTFPYKEFVLGVMSTVFLWEEYLRYHTLTHTAAHRTSPHDCTGQSFKR
jgi:hypothetical protein